MAEQITFSLLHQAVSGAAAALRSVTRLQPVGGPGDKLFPATYSGGTYATEKRRLPGEEQLVDCVLINSVQSESNHAELALKDAYDGGSIRIPVIEVDLSSTSDFAKPLANLTSLEVPHRLADAILRDSVLPDGTRFQKSSHAVSWSRANLWNATPIYELCPTALLFGMWGSPDKPGGLGAKFERAYVSEIVAVDTSGPQLRPGFRIDPLEIGSSVSLRKKPEGGFAIVEGKGLSPSELNHGNIPWPKKGVLTNNAGVRCRYVEQTTVISLGALRKLRFPDGATQNPERDWAGRTVLAALGLCAAVLATERGTSLRSRCQLWPEAPRQWELLETPGQLPRTFTITGIEATALVQEAVAAAKALGLTWREEKLTLTPSPELLELIRRSQEVSAAESGEGEPA
jgi:CRISPR-associated protein Csb1